MSAHKRGDTVAYTRDSVAAELRRCAERAARMLVTAGNVLEVEGAVVLVAWQSEDGPIGQEWVPAAELEAVCS